MKVLHLMARMAPGGTEHQLTGMLEAAHGRYWDATLCLLSSGWQLVDRVRRAGIPVIELGRGPEPSFRKGLELRRLSREFDVIHSSLSGANIFARLATVGMRDRVLVVSERGVESSRGKLRIGLDRVLRSRTDAFIGNSSAVTDFIRSAHGITDDDRRIFEITNGIDTSVFRPGPARSAGSPIRLVTVGRLIPGKRTEDAIAVLAALLPAHDAELVVVGDGPERGRLERMANGLPVHFAGHMGRRDELASIIGGSDVFLMPSESEGLPNALLEALACGVPAVASDIPGVRAADGPGLALVSGDVDQWCEKVLEAVASGRQSTSLLGARGGSFDDVARRHLDVFEWAIDHRKGRDRDSRSNSVYTTTGAT